MSDNAIQQALLPPDLSELTLADLEVGDSAWTVPWAMWVDRDRKCWLHPDSAAHERGGGTAQMLVARTEKGYGIGLLPDCDHKWLPSDEPATRVFAPAWIPVVEIYRHQYIGGRS